MISRNVPRLRLKYFDDEWKNEKLGNASTIQRGASPRPITNPKWFDDDSNIGWIRISDVTEQNGKIRHLSQHISELGQKKTRVLKEPHLLLSIAASVGKPVINYVPTGVHDGFLIFKNIKFDMYFMFYFLEYFQEYWQKYGQPGSQVNLNASIVRQQFVGFPSLIEQQHIGNFFSKLDHLIDLHSQKLEQLKKLKRGYLQKMFPQKGENVPRLRFSGFSDKWKEIRLKNISRCETSKYTQGQFKEEPNNGIYKVFDVSGISGSINEYDQEHNYISIVKDGSGVGTVTLRPAKTSVINTMNYIINDNSNIKYLFYLLETFNFYRYKIGTGIPHIYYSDYSNEKVRVPSIDEQKKIGSFFNNLDKKIKFENDKIEELKKQKKAYLQKMFI